MSVDEAELELLRQFDLAWQYGPCTGENPFRPQGHIPEPVLSPTRLKQQKPLPDALKHYLLRWECRGPHTPLHTHSLVCTLLHPL